MMDLENKTYKDVRDNQIRWEQILNDYKENCNSELLRKQTEIKRLNDVLGTWICKYMELQETLPTEESERRLPH